MEEEMYEAYQKLQEHEQECKYVRDIEIQRLYQELENSVPISLIEKKIEELEKIKQKDEVDEFGIHSRDWWVADIIQEQFKELLDERNNTDV